VAARLQARRLVDVPNRVDVADVLGGERRHLHATMQGVHHEALALELGERLAHGDRRSRDAADEVLYRGAGR
jgi:hypothetical protein